MADKHTPSPSQSNKSCVLSRGFSVSGDRIPPALLKFRHAWRCEVLLSAILPTLPGTKGSPSVCSTMLWRRIQKSLTINTKQFKRFNACCLDGSCQVKGRSQTLCRKDLTSRKACLASSPNTGRFSMLQWKCLRSCLK